jgi:hypothetical protein
VAHRVSLGILLLFATFLPSPALAQQKEIVIPADKLAAPEQVADQPAAGKWWLKRDAQDWGAADGKILMAGQPSDQPFKAAEWQVPALSRFVPYRVPTLEIDPHATGWNRIYVGAYCDDIEYFSRPMLAGKLTGEPYPEYLQPPFRAKGKTAELYWKAADLTGKKIYLSQPAGPTPHAGSGWMCGITHVRVVPMTEKEVADARKEIELPPAERQLFCMLDYTDEAMWNGTVESEDDIRAIVYRHQQAGFARVYWRCYGTCQDNSLDVPEAAPRWTAANEAAFCKSQNCMAGWMPYIENQRRFDLLKVAVEYGKTIGCDVHGWFRFNAHNRYPYANFWYDHPEYQVQLLSTTVDPKTKLPVPVVPYKRNRYSRCLSLAYPEVRTYYVKVFKQLASTGTRGVMIDLLRHPPIAGYEPITCEAFKKKYGKEMELLDIYRDPLVQEHFAGYMRLFLAELRAAIGNDIEISVRTSGPNGFGLAGKEFVDAGLINTIVDGNWYSGNGPRPTIDATVEAVGSRGHAFAVAETGDVDWQKQYEPIKNAPLSAGAIAALAKVYSGRGVERFGSYESTVFTRFPDLRRAIREAAWEYEPARRR